MGCRYACVCGENCVYCKSGERERYFGEAEDLYEETYGNAKREKVIQEDYEKEMQLEYERQMSEEYERERHEQLKKYNKESKWKQFQA